MGTAILSIANHHHRLTLVEHLAATVLPGETQWLVYGALLFGEHFRQEVSVVILDSRSSCNCAVVVLDHFFVFVLK